MTISNILYSQAIVSGYIEDGHGTKLVGVEVEEVNTSNRTFSDENGYFELEVIDYNSIIKFSLIGFQSFSARIDTWPKNNIFVLEVMRIKLISPGISHHPYLKVGYKGYITDLPIGLQATYASWYENFKLQTGIATKDYNEYYSYLVLYPYRLKYTTLRKYINPNIKGFITFTDTISNSEIFVLNDLHLSNYLSLRFGAGIELINRDRDTQPIFVSGFRFDLRHERYLEFDLFIRQNTIEWIGYLSTEIYDRGSHSFSLNLGYQNSWGLKSVIAGINYKTHLVN
jgi:hypothetical protein